MHRKQNRQNIEVAATVVAQESKPSFNVCSNKFLIFATASAASFGYNAACFFKANAHALALTNSYCLNKSMSMALTYLGAAGLAIFACALLFDLSCRTKNFIKESVAPRM